MNTSMPYYPGGQGPDGSTITSRLSPGYAPPAQKHQHRVGLFLVRVGAEIPHKLMIDLPLAEPDHSTRTTRRARTNLAKDKFVWGENKLDIPIGAPAGTKGSPCPVAIRAGQVVTQGTVDGTRDDFLTAPEAKHLKFACMHASCSGKRWPSADECRREHPTDKELRERQEAHGVYGVVELPEKKDGKTGEVTEATLILVGFDTRTFDVK